jgi:zinc protease
MPRTIALLAALLLLAACGGTREDKIFPYAYQVDDLPNGLRLVTVNTGYPNIVALYVVVQVGSRNEVEPGRSGFAHLFEHMMFRGTEKYPPEKWEEIMQAAGAQNNAYTSDDRTVYHAVFSKEDLEPILELEADRFQNLKYSQEVFQTETRAVLSEYNKNFSSPTRKLEEVVRDAAFQKHPYKHTTMGFIEDVENMPTMYDYGLQFFDRYYRPEYTVVCVVGDVTPEQVRPLVEKYWGSWKRGDYRPEIPAEPPQTGPKQVTADFQAPTLPWLSVSFHAPAYDDEAIDSAVLDVISFQAFSENSELYKKLVLDEQKVDVLEPDYYDHVDPYLFSVEARVKNPADVEYVEKQILATFEKLKTQPLPAEELESVKSHLRYQFALGMDSTAAIADTLAAYISLRRTPETINKRYALYQKVTAADVEAVAKKYFVDDNRTVATLRYKAEGAPEKTGAEKSE